MKVVHGFTLQEQPAPPHPAANAYSDRALELSSRPLANVVVHRDIAWGADAWRRFDVFTPASATEPRPVLIFLHGGGWMSGYKEWCGLTAPGVIESGAILAAPTYRLAPEHRYPVFLEDCIDAVDAIRLRAHEFGGDPERLYIAGHSAGGHLAAMVALRQDLWNGRIGRGLRGVLPISAILDVVRENPEPGSLEELVYLKVLARREDDVAASPTTWAAAARVPFVLTWGGHDTERVLRSNAKMVALLRAANAPCAARCLAGLNHFETHLALASPTHAWFEDFRRLMESQHD